LKSKQNKSADDTECSQEKPGNSIVFLPNEPSNSGVDLNDDAIAEDFAIRYADQLRFDHEVCRWFVWKGSHWALNKTELAFDFARHLCRKHRNGQSRMASKKAAEGVEHMARRDQRLAVTSDKWDRDPYLLGTPGDTVDLRTGQLKAPSRDDYITKVVAVTPAPPGTPCPLFNKFLEEATGGDQGLQRFLQQWAGYCLTGDTSEQALLFVYGPGGNGKGVFLTVLTEVMGDYAKTAAMETFVASKQQRHLTELAMLHGARLVTASETEKHQAWSQSRINQLTGGDKITANFMRRDHFTFKPQFKLTIIGNHKPKLETVDEAARRRFNIVPFLHKPKEPDKALGAKLRDEYPAILRWMIEGSLDRQANGLMRPDVVSTTTDEYFEEQDLIGQWIAELCEVGPNCKAGSSELFESWKSYAEKHNEYAGSAKSFGPLLEQRGFIKTKTGGIVHYVGLQLKYTGLWTQPG
jgi:putative DNA primase/helicase